MTRAGLKVSMWQSTKSTCLDCTRFRHACGVELLKRSGGNLRAVQEHLRHADIQTTTIYTRLAPQDLQKVVNLFDDDGK